jgi:hypothetical protein
VIWRLAKSHLPNVQSVAYQINFKPNKIWADRVLDLKGKPLKNKVDDIMLISKAFDEEERMISKNSMRWRPSSGLFSVIHSKLGGYTHWVNESSTPKDIMLISKAWDENKTMLTSKAWVLKRLETKTFEWVIFSNPLEAQGLHPMDPEFQKAECRPLKHKPETEHRFLRNKAKADE